MSDLNIDDYYLMQYEPASKLGDQSENENSSQFHREIQSQDGEDYTTHRPINVQNPEQIKCKEAIQVDKQINKKKKNQQQKPKKQKPEKQNPKKQKPAETKNLYNNLVLALKKYFEINIDSFNEQYSQILIILSNVSQKKCSKSNFEKMLTQLSSLQLQILEHIIGQMKFVFFTDSSNISYYFERINYVRQLIQIQLKNLSEQQKQ